jgi:hypothetical protein
MIYDDLIEKLLIHFTGPTYKDQVTLAKKEFFERSGVIDEEDQLFEIRMSQFLDWFLFSRKLALADVTPVEYALQNKEFVVSHNERPRYERLAAHQHSLYEFVKLRGGDVHIKDLYSDKKIVLKNSDMTLGFNYDEIFDARIVPAEDSFVFAKGFCFHPSEAKKFILKEIKATKNLDLDAREAFLLRLLKMRYKLDQYKHIKLDQIYSNDSKLRF